MWLVFLLSCLKKYVLTIYSEHFYNAQDTEQNKTKQKL